MSHQSRQTAPPYSEEQVTRWLAFLARGMKKHDQTIFLIEKVQPSWLTAQGQSRLYIFASRLLWGFLSGLVSGLGIWLTGTSYAGLVAGLLLGLSMGVLMGLIDISRMNGKFPRPAQGPNSLLRQIVWGIVLAGLIPALLAGLSGVLQVGMMTGLINALLGWLIFGVIGGSIWVLRSEARGHESEIKTVETVRFLRSAFPKGFRDGLIVGFIIGIVVAVIGLLAINSNLEGVVRFHNVLTTVLPGGVISGLILGLFAGLVSCVQPGIREMKTTPNQGIQLSLRSAALIGGSSGLVLGAIAGFLGDWTAGLVYGVLGGLSIALWYGGLDVIQHYIVRFLLWRSGSLPWRLATFLDYAAEELHFLQKMGGGYIFVHRYLLEHFAAMGEETTDG